MRRGMLLAGFFQRSRHGRTQLPPFPKELFPCLCAASRFGAYAMRFTPPYPEEGLAMPGDVNEPGAQKLCQSGGHGGESVRTPYPQAVVCERATRAVRRVPLRLFSPSADNRNTASTLARPSTSISSSTASFDCSISSASGSKAYPLRVRNCAQGRVSCWWIGVMFFGGWL
jgi:hypothetical protein